MAKQHSPYAAADAAADLRAHLNRVARHTPQVMFGIAATYTNAAATYRHMARQRGSGSLRFYQHAARIDQRAAKARRFAE